MEEQRLQKIISDRGYCSRRRAEQLIAEGRVQAAGQIVEQQGTKYPVDVKIFIDGREVPLKKEAYKYVLLNKPNGILTTACDDRGRKTVMDLLPPGLGRLFPVGRLDLNTHGALFLTDDGEFANLVMHPSSSLNKTYQALIEGSLTTRDILSLKKGVLLEDGLTAPANVEVVRSEEESSLVRITIHEGRKREVRRMLEFVGHPVLDLERIFIGPIGLGDLRRGEYRFLSAEEVAAVKNICWLNKKKQKKSV